MQRSNARRLLLAAFLVLAPAGLGLGGCTRPVQNASDPHEHYVLFFETNSADLTLDGYAICQHAAQAVRELHATNVTVAGYSGKVGSEAENHNIAERRTATVKKTLIDLGTDPGIIATLPVGSADDNFGPTGDRRIEIRLLRDSSLAAGAPPTTE